MARGVAWSPTIDTLPATMLFQGANPDATVRRDASSTKADAISVPACRSQRASHDGHLASAPVRAPSRLATAAATLRFVACSVHQ